MKMYVTAYALRPEYKEAHKKDESYPQHDSMDVQVFPKPEWTFLGRHLAEVELQIVRNMRVHFGTHYCEYELEEVKPDVFAIVCNDHPVPPVR